MNAAAATLTPAAGDAFPALKISGAWSIRAGFPEAAAIAAAITATPAAKKTPPPAAAPAPAATETVLPLDASGLERYDSSLPAFLLELHRQLEPLGIRPASENLPPDLAGLLKLALAHADNDGNGRADIEEFTGDDAASTAAAARRRAGDAAREAALRATLTYRLGAWALASARAWNAALEFTGRVAGAFANFCRGRARVRMRECGLLIQDCGADALPIIALVSSLTGLILAYLGVLQMRQVGAVTMVPGAVALSMLREMGVLMTGVILCGRTATAYAAQLATMNVSEETAALRVLGISPYEYLVLPRFFALFLMTPLLTLYANLCGIAGGLLVVAPMGIPLEQGVEMTLRVIKMPSVAAGLIKAFVFAILIAWSGCFRGMNAGKSSQAVGDATTSAAVLGITLLVIADAVFAVLFDVIHFF
ncbi:MAG: ABC transporter permease [Puniceicoccales bacterium]|jgi:phospholipid/cholesterol/gamma-HCH transport system permease protein|nr:ABC transporter permease [Puniceicoccales bacterium]